MNYEEEQRRLLHLLETFSDDDDQVAADDESEPEDVDIVENREENSESEQDLDIDDNTETPMRVYYNGGKNSQFYFGKTKWKIHCPSKDIHTRRGNMNTQFPGVREILRGNTDPLNIFRHFIDNDLLEMIVKFTNQHISKFGKGRYCQEYQAKETNKLEIEALIGILIISGVQKSNRLNSEDLFATDGNSVEILRLCMNQQRFKFLLSHMRFDDADTREERKQIDNLAPIRDYFEKFNSNCMTLFSLSQYTTIDEMLLAFRGKATFHQYIPSKPAKYGIKVYNLCDAKLFYTFNMEIYAGKQPSGSPYAISNAPCDVVKRLTQPISGTNRNLTTDNWSSRYKLSEKLIHKYHIGTIRKNKLQVPPVFTQLQGRSIPLIVSGVRENCTVVSTKPKKNVILTSSTHADNSVDNEAEMPEIIMETKGGVDVVDRLMSNYNVSRNSRRWPMVIFYALINIAGINSQVILSQNDVTSNIVRRKFLNKIGMGLMQRHLITRASMNNIPRLLRERIQEICKIKPASSSSQEVPAVGRCRKCSSKLNRKTKYRCRVCNKFLCLEHIEVLCRDCE